MKLRTIVFPTDFSDASQAPLNYATALARDTGAKLVIMHVEEPPTPFVAEGAYLPPSPYPNPELKNMLSAIVPGDGKIPYEHVLRTGDPADEIIQYAKNENVDLIVMGTHGRRGIGRLIMGSVAEKVVRNAPCPVLTLRTRDGVKTEAE